MTEACLWQNKNKIIFLLLWTLLGFSQVSLAAPQVQAVVTEVTATDKLPVTVRDRMVVSINTIGDQLLTGKSVVEVTQQQKHYEDLIQEIFDKVLVGYTIQAVVIIPGEETQVQVHLLPWRDTIQEVSVHTEVQGMSPMIEEALRQDITGIESVFEESLQGLPVAATDWTNGLLKKKLNSFLATRAPEFKADFDVKVAPQAQVQVVLYPLLPVVRTVDLKMRSSTMPNTALLFKRSKIQNAANQLIGVPVGFVQRHQGMIEEQLALPMEEDAQNQGWHMNTQVDIAASEQLSVMARVESEDYRMRLEGWADLGRSKGEDSNNILQLRLHLGKMITPQDEILTLVQVYPQHIKWAWSFGYRHSFATGTTLGIGYDVLNEHLRAEAEQKLADRWLLRYEFHNETNKYSEWALRYRLHDFLDLELATDCEDMWLRMIGYF